MDINAVPEYKALISEIDEKVQRLHQVLQKHLGDGDPTVVFGWLLSVGLTGIDAEGDYDDTFQITSPGMNNFTAAGVAMVTAEYHKQAAMGLLDLDDDV